MSAKQNTASQTSYEVDSSGFQFFSAGELGAMHAMAHEMLDEGRELEGLRILGEWLEGRQGRGSEWVHLQWHMAVFEIAVGRWEAALRRFENEIAPVAVSSFDALTDGPAMLWRLWLAAPRPVSLPWEAVAGMARKSLRFSIK